MKHLSHRTIAIIVALLSTLSLALAVISLPHQAYAVDGTDGTSGTNSTSQGSDGDSAPIAGPVPNIIITNFAYGVIPWPPDPNSISTSPSRTWVRWR